MLKSYFIPILFIAISLSGFAQVNATHLDDVDRIRGGTTYVCMKDTTSPISREYMDVFKKYWTLSQVKFIDIYHEDIMKHVA